MIKDGSALTDEEVLQNFLLDIDCLDELVPWTKRFNLFDVLKISRTEIRHSNILGWLLTPNENHGLGDAFLRAIIQCVVQEDDNGRYTARQAREQWHLAGPFQYVLESREGTAFGNRCTGPVLQQADNSDYKISVSAHGHLPTKGPQPTFFAAGPQVRPGVTVARGRLIDEAPTWAALLGLTMPAAQGRPVRELLRD